MSYSRWTKGNNWYAFYSTEECLALWHSNGNYIDWLPEELQGIDAADIMEKYECSKDDAREAIKYIEMFLEDVKNN